MTTRLTVFNSALRLIGEETISDPDVSSKPGRELRAAFPEASAVCLSSGNWNFAIERSQLVRGAAPPRWGYKYAYQTDASLLKIVFVSPSGFERDDTRDYADEKGLLLCDHEALYVKWVSRDWIEARIGDWSPLYADYVAADLGERVCEVLTGKSSREKGIDRETTRRRRAALAFDAQQSPQARRNPGSFVTARRSRLGIRNGWETR